jgi:hypothetical protein
MRTGIAALATVFLVAACGSAAGGGGSAVTRDSAGIQIVESSGPAWETGKGWRVVDSPLVDIGSRGGDPVFELEQVRGPLRLGDGRLAIANGATNDIRLYDVAGKHLRTTGRTGGGPGEYQNIAGILLGPGDSLLVLEPVARRLSVLDHDANFVRAISLGGQGGQFVPINGKLEVAMAVGWLADGSVVGLSQAFAINSPRQGPYRDSLTAIRYGPDGAVRDTLGRIPGIEMEQITMTMGAQSFSAPTPVPLGKQTVTAVGANRIYVAQNNSWEIEIRGADGTLHSLLRSPIQASRLTPADIAAHRKEQLAAIEAQPMMRNVPEAIKQQITSRVEQAKYPETMPFFAALLVDPEGNLWAQESTPPAEKSQRFAVVDSTGRLLGRVTLPSGFHATWIGADAVYGVWKDEEDVEHIRGYPLRKQ